MLAAAIIVFREVIEAGLIVGIVLAASRGVPHRVRYVSGGIAAGVSGAGLLAAFAGTIANAVEGAGQEIFNACVLGLAVAMLAWHNVWMAQHGRQLAAELKAAGQAVAAGSKTLLALAAVVGIAVLREGAEVVLFLYGIVLSNNEGGVALFSGGLLGLAAGAALSALTYAGLVTIPSRYLFSVTSYMIALLAAGMASQCAAQLQQADIVSVLSGTLWDTSSLLASDTILGRVLHTLIGYDERPTALQVVVYAVTLAAILIAMRLFAPAHAKPAAAAKPMQPASSAGPRVA